MKQDRMDWEMTVLNKWTYTSDPYAGKKMSDTELFLTRMHNTLHMKAYTCL